MIQYRYMIWATVISISYFPLSVLWFCALDKSCVWVRCCWQHVTLECCCFWVLYKSNSGITKGLSLVVGLDFMLWEEEACSSSLLICVGFCEEILRQSSGVKKMDPETQIGFHSKPSQFVAQITILNKKKRRQRDKWHKCVSRTCIIWVRLTVWRCFQRYML